MVESPSNKAGYFLGGNIAWGALGGGPFDSHELT